LEIKSIIHTHKDKIFKTCLGFTGNVEEAKDLVQEVCINLWRGLDSFQQNAQISTWVYRVTVNTCLMYKRKKRLNLLPLTNIPNTLASQESTEKGNEKDLQLLQRFIAELPEKERVIMILYLENLSYEEMADITGLTSNYIGVRINRIKKSLTKKFNQHGRITSDME